MAWALKIALKGNLKDYLDADTAAFARAAASTTRRKTNQLAKRQKAHIARRMGVPLSRSTRSAAYPANGAALQPRGEVWFEATRKTDSGPLDIIDLFQTGAQVRPVSSRLLWVPTDAGRRLGRAPKNKPRALQPSNFRGGELLYLPLRGRARNARIAGRLVLRANPSITVFVGVRRGRLRRRLRLDPIYTSVMRNYVELRNRAWDRELRKLAGRIR